jgi:hypothetical protein
MTTSDERRRELRAAYEQRSRDPGVYLLRNTVTGRVLVGSTPDLRSIRNRLEFGRATGSTGVLDRRLAADARAYGMGAFELEVLDVLAVTPEMSADELALELRTLEALWREKLADAPQY